MSETKEVLRKCSECKTQKAENAFDAAQWKLFKRTCLTCCPATTTTAATDQQQPIDANAQFIAKRQSERQKGTRCVVLPFIADTGGNARVLLGVRCDGSVDVIGGGQKAGETCRESAARELVEETAWTLAGSGKDIAEHLTPQQESASDVEKNASSSHPGDYNNDGISVPVDEQRYDEVRVFLLHLDEKKDGTEIIQSFDASHHVSQCDCEFVRLSWFPLTFAPSATEIHEKESSPQNGNVLPDSVSFLRRPCGAPPPTAGGEAPAVAGADGGGNRSNVSALELIASIITQRTAAASAAETGAAHAYCRWPNRSGAKMTLPAKCMLCGADSVSSDKCPRTAPDAFGVIVRQGGLTKSSGGVTKKFPTAFIRVVKHLTATDTTSPSSPSSSSSGATTTVLNKNLSLSETDIGDGILQDLVTSPSCALPVGQFVRFFKMPTEADTKADIDCPLSVYIDHNPLTTPVRFVDSLHQPKDLQQVATVYRDWPRYEALRNEALQNKKSGVFFNEYYDTIAAAPQQHQRHQTSKKKEWEKVYCGDADDAKRCSTRAVENTIYLYSVKLDIPLMSAGERLCTRALMYRRTMPPAGSVSNTKRGKLLTQCQPWTDGRHGIEWPFEQDDHNEYFTKLGTSSSSNRHVHYGSVVWQQCAKIHQQEGGQLVGAVSPPKKLEEEEKKDE